MLTFLAWSWFSLWLIVSPASCWNRGCNAFQGIFLATLLSTGNVLWFIYLFIFPHQSKGSPLFGITFSSMYLGILVYAFVFTVRFPWIAITSVSNSCHNPPLDVERAVSLISSAEGETCGTDKAVAIETVDSVTEGSLVVACPSQLPRAYISLMSHDCRFSTFPVSQKMSKKVLAARV